MRKTYSFLLALTVFLSICVNASASASAINLQSETEPNYDLATFNFDQDLEGWQVRSSYQASFGTPGIEHSTAIGGGAMRINAVIGTSTNWQELKLVRALPSIGQATTVTFDVYMDMSLIDLELYGDKKIKPYIAVDPGWVKFGQNESVSSVSDLQRVNEGGKEYGVLHVISRLIGGHEAGTQLNLNFLSDGIVYTGPIYIDNVKVSNAPFNGGSGEEPGVLPDNNQTQISTLNFDTSPIKLVDRDATAESRSLFSYLKNVSGNYLLFGHQNSTTRGATITQNNGTQSDVYQSVGAFPAVYGWDTNALDGSEPPYSPEALRTAMRLAYERGGIVTLSAHMPNFVSGGNFYDTVRVVENILPGASHHQQYLDYLDKIADFANNLKDSEDTLIPVIFRPFHEHNGNWFWWGAPYAKGDEYIALYRFTVEYLRDVKGVRNFLYEFSPNGFFSGDSEQYLYRYPGDEYVDILGFDIYDGSYNQIFRDQLVEDAAMLVQLAESKGKIAALAEAGVRNGHTVSGNPNLNWWTELMEDLKADPVARKLAYILTWTNSSANSFWVPYRNHPVFGNSEMLEDFITFYNDDYTAFGDRLSGVYDLQVQIDSNDSPYAYLATPVRNQIVKGPITIRAGAYGDTVTSVVYSIAGGQPQQMQWNPGTGYYEAAWTPGPELNGQTVDIQAQVAFGSTIINEQAQVAVRMDTIQQQFAFGDANEALQFSNGGTYNAANGTPALEHDSALEALRINADISGSNASQTWQELKVKINQIQNAVPLANIDKIKFDVLIPTASLPTTLNQAEVKLLPNLYLFPNTQVKYGKTNPQARLADLPRVLRNGSEFAKHSVSIDLTGEDKKTATDLVIALVFGKLNYIGPIYMDNVQFIVAANEGTIVDPSIIDDFETYDDDNNALREVFTSVGDTNKISLAQAPKHNGQYAMKFDYRLATNGYSGIQKLMGNSDWRAYDKLNFWYKPDGSGQKMVVQIKAQGISFEYYPSLAGTGEDLLEIPFSAFRPAPYEANQNAVLDASNLQKIEKFSIFVNAASPGYVGNGTLYLDEIRLSGASIAL
ncbi:glycosyl hydrolase [Cohnella herbarum]|uniref:GH26 domain-containing protein n=1 Tax=Cohnella herbarum TaxID=2728023 RepID=A0A7Z2ZM20_9BACL|nr:glycosyl hydrolase [Cohnella herbarum]QJD84514.1 hypothetical protein HH215_15905 [Cohnella herbarum]